MSSRLFPDDVWRIIKSYVITEKICCGCNGVKNLYCVPSFNCDYKIPKDIRDEMVYDEVGGRLSYTILDESILEVNNKFDSKYICYSCFTGLICFNSRTKKVKMVDMGDLLYGDNKINYSAYLLLEKMLNFYEYCLVKTYPDKSTYGNGNTKFIRDFCYMTDKWLDFNYHLWSDFTKDYVKNMKNKSYAISSINYHNKLAEKRFIKRTKEIEKEQKRQLKIQHKKTK
jgi:hypothetical protein